MNLKTDSRGESVLKVVFSETSTKLNLFFASLCVIDLFGVFPIVTLPKSLISCGFYGVPLLLFVLTIQIYTAVVLGRCWTIAEKLDPNIVEKNRYPYAAVAELTYGPKMSRLVTILLDMTVFGAGIPNLLVASQNLQLLGLRITEGKFDFSFCYYLLIIGLFLCPMMWLGSPKNMRLLASASVLICTSVAVLTWFCIFYDPSENSRNVGVSAEDLIEYLYKPPFLNLLKAYGIIAFQFDIHPMLLTIQVDMQNKRKIGNAVGTGMFITTFLSVVTTILIYIKYGTTVTSNVLESLPRSWTLYLVILLVTLQLCLSSVIGNSALFLHLEDIFHISRDFCVKRCLIRSILVCCAIVIGEFIPKFDLVMGIIGGTLTGPLIFILPPLIYTKMLQLEEIYESELKLMKDSHYEFTADNDEHLLLKSINGKHNYGTMKSTKTKQRSIQDKIKGLFKKLVCIIQSECILASAVIIFGLFATFSSTYYNIFDLKNFNQFWSPCIKNISLSYMFLDLYAKVPN